MSSSIPSTGPSGSPRVCGPAQGSRAARALRLLALLLLAGAGALLGAPGAGGQGRVAALQPMGPLLPDGDFVYGPALYGWDLKRYVAAKGGLLARYYEPGEGGIRSGVDIVGDVALAYSISPRLLLTLIEMHSGWVTQADPAEQTYPLGGGLPGLAASLAAAADSLNARYYGHRLGGQRDIPGLGRLAEGNAATYALLSWLGEVRAAPPPSATAADPSAPTALPAASATPQPAPAELWAGLEGPSRFWAAWMGLFGDPVAADAGQVVPVPARPLPLPLPFAAGEIWYLTRGPHSPWGAGGPAAALDFAPPPADQADCSPSTAWVRAVAGGIVLRSEPWGLLVDLDEDGFAGTGWVHAYTHLAGLERLPAGSRVAAGDTLGHPSCEGGPSAFARVGFSRRLDGQWIPVDAERDPLIMGGWAALRGDRDGAGWLAREGLPARRAAPEKEDAVNGVFDLSIAPPEG